MAACVRLVSRLRQAASGHLMLLLLTVLVPKGSAREDVHAPGLASRLQQQQPKALGATCRPLHVLPMQLHADSNLY